MATDWTYRMLAAEFLATALFVWIGTGAAVSSNLWTLDGVSDPARLITIAIAFGFAISVLVYGIAHISGGHINPAVTFSFMIMGEQSIVGGLLYMVAQFTGAIVGSLFLWATTTGLTKDCVDATHESGVCSASLSNYRDDFYGPAFALGVNQVGSNVTDGNAFLIEAIGTFLLVITVLNTAVDKKSMAQNIAPTAIGWSVLLCHIVLIPFTGCGINPARSFGPMVVITIGGLADQAWMRGWWVFYTAPFVGSLFATAVYKFILETPAEEAVEKTEEVAAAEKPAAEPVAAEESA